MKTDDVVRDAHQRVQDAPWEESDDSQQEARGVYLGTVFELDPCRNYHPSEAPDRCVKWWDRLRRQLELVGLMLEHGAGDPCDIYATEHRWRERPQKRPIKTIALTPSEREVWLQQVRDSRVRGVERARSGGGDRLQHAQLYLNRVMAEIQACERQP